MLHWYWEVKFIVISLILTRVISTIFYILWKKICLYSLWLPFVINHSRLIALRSTSYWRGQWISEYIYSTERQYTNLFLRFSVNWPQLLGIFVCTGVNLVASFLIILNLYRRSVTWDVKPRSAHIGSHTDWILFEGKSNASYCD